MALLKDLLDEIAVRLLPGRNTPLNKLNDEDRALVLELKEKSLLDLSDKKLVCLADVAHKLEQDKLPGLFIEAGCKLGGSTTLLAHIKNPRRPMFVYDLFDSPPMPTGSDTSSSRSPAEGIVGGNAQPTERNKRSSNSSRYETVKSNLKQFGIALEQYSVNLINGAIEDTLAIKQQVAFAHIGLNDYSAVKVCLQRLSPWIPIDGSLFISNYDVDADCRKATDEFLSEKAAKFVVQDTAGARTLTRATF